MLRLSDWIFTFADLRNFFRRLFEFVKNASKKDWLGFLIIVVLAVAMHFGLHFSLEGIFFWLFFFVLVFWNLDSRISIGLALAGLVVIPFLLALSSRGIFFASQAAAEQVAVWVYFFLVIGVAKQIIELKFESRKVVKFSALTGIRSVPRFERLSETEKFLHSHENIRSVRFSPASGDSLQAAQPSMPKRRRIV